MSNPRPEERGTVLLSVLLLVVALSSLAYAMTDDLRFGIRRSANVADRSQAQWYAVGAESLAQAMIGRGWERDPGRTLLPDEWATDGIQFPIEGGLIHARLSDGSNCFNLNSLVESDGDGRFVANPLARRLYTRLLTALGFADGEGLELTNVLTDWLDSDTAMAQRGAEDAAYALLSPPYRTGNTLLADESELRSMQGYNLQVYELLRPFVCALPAAEPIPLNVNTLREEQAPLLVMLVGGELSLSQARDVIAQRPATGYRNLADFWATGSLAGLEADPDTSELVSLRARYFVLHSDVYYRNAYVALNSTLALDASGAVSLVSREYGAVQ